MTHAKKFSDREKKASNGNCLIFYEWDSMTNDNIIIENESIIMKKQILDNRWADAIWIYLFEQNVWLKKKKW